MTAFDALSSESDHTPPPSGEMAARFPATDSATCQRNDASTEAFEAARRRVLAAGKRKPSVRLASLFLVIARNNRHEGRDPSQIAETLTCGTVAGLLDLSIDTLAEELATFESKGLVEAGQSGGLRLVDIPALEALSDEA